MNKINTFSKNIATIAAFFALSLAGPSAAFAATAPDLGAATGYSLYGDAGVTNTGAGTHVWGNVGDNSLGHPGLLGTQVDGTIDAGVGVAGAAGTAYGALDAQGATGNLDLAGTHTVTPGVYTVGATTLNGTLTLDGAGVYIFRSSSSISTSGAGTMNLINGATACNVFWQIPTSMTIGTGTHMEGTIIAQTGLISLGTDATLVGRALAHTQVTLDSNQVTEPTCVTPPPPSSGTGGSSTGALYFPLLPAISILKAPNPSVLPLGPGPVTYTYTVTNPGKVALNTVWVKDNKCAPVQYVSGDTNSNGLLDLSETWTYTCTKTVSQTETDTATAHGYGVALRMDVYATANATVVVSAPTVTGEVLGTSTSTVPVVPAVPSFPNTGFPPQDTTPWIMLVLSGVLLAASVSLTIAFKKRAE